MHQLQKFFMTIQNFASKPSRFFSRPFPFDVAQGRLSPQSSTLRLRPEGSSLSENSMG